ncbi:MAG TPA: sugar ABC transporter ATP-binding protein [Verrucomicrobiales bacterium]|nr:sugar ABC transporter ATP-binding protein [Verrucomicrobiales bacterium]
MIATPASPQPLLVLRGIRKRFGGVVALDGVDFDLHAGEIHALLGENGAGKSTLIRILAGLHRPDEGTVLMDGAPAQTGSVTSAQQAGIRVIHQELTLAPNLTIAENLFLGREPRRFGLLDHRRMRAEAQRLLSELGFSELSDVLQRAGELNTARQQLVEIARALIGSARILVLDEPTASLSEAEARLLFTRLKRLRSEGVGIIYISHRLDEIGQLADRITVLRDGRSIGTLPAASVDTNRLISWMVGRELREHYPRPTHVPGEVALSVRDLRAPGVNGVSFDLHAGEVLGLAGLVGAGRTELARALAGLAPVFSGEISAGGRVVRFRSVADARAAGIVLVPEDRKREGLVMNQTLGFNLALPWTHLWNRGIARDSNRRAGLINKAASTFHIKASSADAGVATLSGGNQQKAVISKWMEQPPKVLILDEPTRGVDVGAREEIFALIGRLVAQRMAVLLISSDLPEVMNLSHRLALYREGRILCEGAAGDFTPEEVMSRLTLHTPPPAPVPPPVTASLTVLHE